MIEVICLIAGIIIGVTIKNERDSSRYNKTVEQVDEQVRKDLAFYRNLSDSLKQDVSYLKFQLSRKDKQ